MNVREGFRRAARVTAWAYWLCAVGIALLLISHPTTLPRSEFSLRGPDGQMWQVSGYDPAEAQAFLNRSVTPKPALASRVSAAKTVGDQLRRQEASGSDDPWSAVALSAGEASPTQSATRSTPDFMVDDEPDHADTHGAWRNVVIELGAALAVYVTGLAMFRALRWIALGFLDAANGAQ